MVLKIPAPTGINGETLAGLFDPSSDGTQARLQTTPTAGYAQAAVTFNASTTTTQDPPSVTDNT